MTKPLRGAASDPNGYSAAPQLGPQIFELNDPLANNLA